MISNSLIVWSYLPILEDLSEMEAEAEVREDLEEDEVEVGSGKTRVSLTILVSETVEAGNLSEET